MTNPISGNATGLPIASLPRPMSRGDEFSHLMGQRKRIDLRLTELAEHFGACPSDAPRLPKSGLRIRSLVIKGA